MSAQTETHIEVGDAKQTRRAVAGLVVIHSELDSVVGCRPLAGSFSLGREGDWIIDDTKVSRRHATVGSEHGRLMLRDEGSRNGTFVNGVRVQGSLELQVGDLIRMGRSLFAVVADVGRYGAFPPRHPARWLSGGPSLDEVRETIRKLGPSKLSVLVHGETGSGKEHAARALHAASGRSGPFVPVNCAAIPSELVESELFGHRAGAFSGASERRRGLFAEAHQGTLFLDEVGELPLEIQAKLLRVLEDGQVRPVGADRATTVDVRIVAATLRALDADVAAQRFRADLWQRLAGATVVLPPLRERREDVPLLASLLLARSPAPVTAGAMERLCLYAWPGNVRELRHALERGAAFAQADGRQQLDARDLPLARPAEPISREPSPTPPTNDVRTRIETALQIRKGNVAQVARDLGLSRARIYQLLTQHDIDPKRFR